jgi:hypothetical protein
MNESNADSSIALDRNADELASLICSKGLPGIEQTTVPIARTSRSIGLAQSSLRDLAESLASEASQATQKKYQQALVKSAEVIIYSLMGAAFSYEHLSLGTRIKPGSYLDSMGLTRRQIEKLMPLMIEKGWAIETRGGYKHEGNPSKSKSTQYYPTEALIRKHCHLLYSEVGDFDDYEPYKYKGESWDRNEDKNISILKSYNEFMREHSWALKQPTYRVLGEAPYTSSRVYTAYQSITQRRIPIRTQTLLDGEPLEEVDFSSNHPWLLAKLFNQDLPSDAYDDISVVSNCSRSDAKTIVVRCIGAVDKNQRGNIKYSLQKQISGDTIDAVIDAAEATMPWLKDNNLLFSGAGNTLQYLEGEIALKMFEWAVNESIPIVNVHDAYACNLRYRDVVDETMHRYRDEVVEENRHLIDLLGA